MHKIKILFVCLGNICRSPMAEAIFHHKVAEKGLEAHFEADSAGTGDWHVGNNADQRTIQTVTRMGIRINHSARQITTADLGYYDYILAMDADNKQNIEALVRADVQLGGKIYLMRDFESLALGTPESLSEQITIPVSGLSVPDPYYGGQEGFQEVYHILERCIENFIAYVVQQHKLKPYVR